MMNSIESKKQKQNTLGWSKIFKTAISRLTLARVVGSSDKRALLIIFTAT